MKHRQGEAPERIETAARRLVEASEFRNRHPGAYARWAQGESELWSAESTDQFTDIGHACREAVQLFVTDLVNERAPADVEPDPQKTVARLRAVLGSMSLPDGVRAASESLLAYFGTMQDLVQRQEHGAQKEGNRLTWEDTRRVVFMSMMVMFELDQVLRSQSDRQSRG